MVESPLGRGQSGPPPKLSLGASSLGDDEKVTPEGTAARGGAPVPPAIKKLSQGEADSGNSGEESGRAKTSIAARLIRVGGALGTVVALILSYLAWSHPQSAEPRAAELRAAGLDISRLEEIQYEPVEDVGGGDAGALDLRLQDSVMDVQVENTGGSPILVTEIEATILYAKYLTTCPAYGGALFAHGMYDIRVPATESIPSKVSARKPIQVDPNSFGRFTVSVGPISDVPWVYAVELMARTSNAEQQVNLGRATVVNPSWALGEYRAQPYSRDPRSEQCIRDNHRALTEALSMSSSASEDVRELQQRFDRAVAALDRDSNLSEEQESAHQWASVTLDDCREAGQETALMSEDYGDLNGDGLPEVILTQRCVREATLTPNIVRVFDGTSSPSSPKLISPLIGKGDGLDPRGLQVGAVEVVNERMVVYSDIHRAQDRDNEPSVFASDVYAWTGMAVGREMPRSCTSSSNEVISCEP